MSEKEPAWMDRASEVTEDLARLFVDPGAIVTGWVLVFETITPDGDRALHRWSGPSTTTSWAVQGFLHNALHSEWEEGDGEDAS